MSVSLAGGGPAGADTASSSGTLGSGGTYNRVGVGSCALSGITVPYSVMQFTQNGASATSINVSVSASGFSPVLTLYQGAFLPGQANVNCFVQATGGSGSSASINTGMGALCCGFTSQNWYVVVAGTNPGDSGTFSVSFESTNTGVTGPGGGPPPDTTDPVLTVPANITTAATSASGAAVSFSATATDDQDSSPTVACSPSSGSTFPIGTTTVNCTATDDAGNTDTGSFTVTVQDTTAPILTVPANVTVEAIGPTGTAVTYPNATATDAVDPSVTASCSPLSGTTFAVGTTTVTCTATDDAGNTGTGTFAVTVQDTVAPAVTPPDDILTEAVNGSGAVVTYANATATDAVDTTLSPACTPASGTIFAIGPTTVTCTVTDPSGNTGSATFTVTVNDSTDPVVTPPADVTAEATSAAGASVVYPNATASDAVDSSITPTCSPASGATFALGSTTVVCTATDDSGNLGSATFTVTVEDTTGPDLVTSDVQAAATSPSGAAVTFTPTATDLVDPDPDISCTPTSGSTFALGTTTVDCAATDDEGNETNESFDVVVVDEGDPVLDVPDNLTVEATSADGADVDFTVTATDDVDADPEIVCTPASGATFALGTTDVSCTATDNDGNSSTLGFTVTVTDTSAPVLDLPDGVQATATGPDGAVVTFTVSAHDAVAGDVTVECSPPSGSLFPIGDTTVTCTASDAGAEPAGLFGQARRVAQVDAPNVATGTFVVTVSQQVTTTTAAPTTTAPPTTLAPTTTLAGDLPTTGSATTNMSLLAAATLLVGGAFVALATLRRRPH